MTKRRSTPLPASLAGTPLQTIRPREAERTRAQLARLAERGFVASNFGWCCV